MLRNAKPAMAVLRDVEGSGEPAFLPAPCLYEVRAGLLRAQATSQAARFKRLASQLMVLPFDEAAAEQAAEIRVALLQRGAPIDAMDVLIASIALAGGHTLVTRDEDYREVADAFGLDVRWY